MFFLIDSFIFCVTIPISPIFHWQCGKEIICSVVAHNWLSLSDPKLVACLLFIFFSLLILAEHFAQLRMLKVGWPSLELFI